MNPGFPPKPGSPWNDPRWAGGAWIKFMEEKKRRGSLEREAAQAEAQAAKVRQEWAAGRLTHEQAFKRMVELTLEDSKGNWWIPGWQSGEWYRYDGRNLVRDTPPFRSRTAAPQSAASAGTTLPVHPSSVVHLFAHHFVGQGSLLSNRVTLPCQSVQVEILQRKAAVAGAAFITLATIGWVKLFLGKRSGRLGMGSRRAVLVEPKAIGANRRGLEGHIAAQVATQRGPQSAVDIVRALRKPSITQHVFEELLAIGCYSERGKLAQLFAEKWVPNCQRILALEAYVQSVKGMIDSFRQANSEVYHQLHQDMLAANK
jgi:hypothetical protein